MTLTAPLSSDAAGSSEASVELFYICIMSFYKEKMRGFLWGFFFFLLLNCKVQFSQIIHQVSGDNDTSSARSYSVSHMNTAAVRPDTINLLLLTQAGLFIV